MNATRNDDPNFPPAAEDPFAELVGLIEEPVASSRMLSPRPATDGWDQFIYEGETARAHQELTEPEFDFRQDSRGPGYAEGSVTENPGDSSWVAPPGAAHVAPELDEPAPAARPVFDGDDGSDLGLALIGLSEPAAPRIAGPAETGAIAPERFQEESEAASPSLTLDDFDALIASELAALKPAPAFAANAAAPAAAQASHFAPEFGASQLAHDAFDHPEEGVSNDSRIAPVGDARSATARRVSVTGGGRTRRVMFFGGGVAAVALVGIFGVYAGGDIIAGATGGGEPVLIRADTEPFKIAPADPGGRVIPNQNKAVYERVARNAPMTAPSQEMLISAAEEPLDISFEDEVSDLPGVMVGAPDLPVVEEVAIAQAEVPAAGAPAALQPHRVRTFDVRPDGTLVPRPDPAAGAPAPAAAAAPNSPLAPLDPVAAVGQPAAPFSVELPNTTAGEAAPAAPQPAQPASEAPAAPPAAAQVEPAAPAAEAAAVAAIEPAAQPAPVPAGAYFVQISSQPSEALAQESMAALSSRYSSVIGGRGMTIQPAEIEGRGTFYRVRITTASQDEANTVCENLQSAGGSCFVTR